MMRAISLLAVGWVLLAGHWASAQPAGVPQAPLTAEAQAAPETSAPEQRLISPDTERRINELRAELEELLEQSRANAEGFVRQFQASTGLTDGQVYGIAVGIVVGALVADLLGNGGLTTIALAAGGAALGNWAMSDG